MCYQSHNWSIFHHPCHKIFSLASLGIPQVIQLKHNFSWRLKNKCSIWECFKFIEVKSNALFLSTFGVKIDVLNKRKWVSRMCENAYLSIKNPKASRALKQALDPGCRMLALLVWLHFATSATFGLRSWAPPLTKWIWVNVVNQKEFKDDLCMCPFPDSVNWLRLKSSVLQYHIWLNKTKS